MGCKHHRKYRQKYYLIFSLAIIIFVFTACATKKIPDGAYFLTKNEYRFQGKKLFYDRVPNYVSQKPRSSIFPLRVYIYNLVSPKYDTILAEYMTFPANMRKKNLRDSLFIKHNHPEYIGKSLFFNRILHNIGRPAIQLDLQKTEVSKDNIRKFFVNKGYWDTQVSYTAKLDSTNKKAQIIYSIKLNDPTYIKDFKYSITDPDIKKIYQENLTRSFIKQGEVLDLENIEKETFRLNDLIKSKGYYAFNKSNEEIYFTADTLSGTKQVPLALDIKKDEKHTPYVPTKIGDVEVVIKENLTDIISTEPEIYKGIKISKIDNQYKNKAVWLPIVLESGEIYNQKKLDLTAKNIASINNFRYQTILNDNKIFSEKDSVLNVKYLLSPLPKQELKIALDAHYSQILNFGFSPSIEYTTRNIFGGAQNLFASISGVVGTTNDAQKNKTKLFNAYELSAQTKVTFPGLLLPFDYFKIVPKKYSPTSSINLGASIQNNIGLGRINFNAGLNYFINVNDRISHQISLLNSQLSFTQNKEKYYDYFPVDKAARDQAFSIYFNYNPEFGDLYHNNSISSDDVIAQILSDDAFLRSLDTNGEQVILTFNQSLLNQQRQTEDVLVSSLNYNFLYNEIGKKEYKNPLYFGAKFELAGNLFGLLKNLEQHEDYRGHKTNYIFGIEYSQFIKFDFDIRKHFAFSNGKNRLIFRQFIGLGIPYGNSSSMPFIRSYYNGGASDIRAWRAFEGLGPSDNELDKKIRSYIMGNVKLTSNIEYRFRLNNMFEGALFADAGNIWNIHDSGIGDQFKFRRFISQMGLGSGFGVRINIAYITLRLDLAYKIHDPNEPKGERWKINQLKPLQPTYNIAFGYPF